jgi:hypothetical protein
VHVDLAGDTARDGRDHFFFVLVGETGRGRRAEQHFGDAFEVGAFDGHGFPFFDRLRGDG